MTDLHYMMNGNKMGTCICDGNFIHVVFVGLSTTRENKR